MNEIKSKQLARFKERQASIGIIGLGYVGLPLALSFVETGFNVIGFDIDDKKVKAIASGTSYIAHITASRVASAVKADKFHGTTDFSQIAKCDAIILCVPTPLDKFREPDLSFVLDTVEAVLPYLKKGQLMSLESTTYPGTTDEELKPRIESKGFKVGEDFFLVYSPEREDPGNEKYNTRTIPKIIGGYTKDCLDVGCAAYEQVIDRLVPVSSTRAAEMTKLLENIHRSVNIGLMNELKLVAAKMDIDLYEVVDAAATKPFGFTAYYPGPGIGGHCIPIDPFYLTWKAREYGVHTRFIELAGEINSSMPAYVVTQTTKALNSQGKALKDARVHIMGISYKKDIDDMRESPSLEIMELLHEAGAKLSYSDPHIPSFPKLRKHYFDLKHEPLTKENIAAKDIIIIATNHSAFDYSLVQKNAKTVIDTRGIYREKYPNVWPA